MQLDFLRVAVLLIVILGAVVVFDIVLKLKTKGKILVLVLEAGNTIGRYLVPDDMRWLEIGKKKFVLDSTKQMLAYYPFGLPAVLATRIGCLLYSANCEFPLDPDALNDLHPIGNWRPEDVKKLQGTHFLGKLADQTKEESKSKLPSWLIPAATVVLVLILMIIVWGLKANVDRLMTIQGG